MTITLSRIGLPDVKAEGKVLEDGSILLDSVPPEGVYSTVTIGDSVAPFPGWFYVPGESSCRGIYAPKWSQNAPELN